MRLCLYTAQNYLKLYFRKVNWDFGGRIYF